MFVQNLRTGARGLDTIEERRQLDRTGPVDLAHVPQVEFDKAAAGKRPFNVRDCLRRRHRVWEIERTYGCQTGTVAVAIGADKHIHQVPWQIVPNSESAEKKDLFAYFASSTDTNIASVQVMSTLSPTLNFDNSSLSSTRVV